MRAAVLAVRKRLPAGTKLERYRRDALAHGLSEKPTAATKIQRERHENVPLGDPYVDAWTPKASAADWGTLRLIRAQIDSAAASALRGATYSDYGRRPNEVIQRDLEWIASDEIWPMSFAWCCQALDLEPAYVRGLIMERRWRTKNGKGWTAPAKWKPFR